MLSVTTTEAIHEMVPLPPRPEQLTPTGWKDWKLGVEFLKTCVDTYDTATQAFFFFVTFRGGIYIDAFSFFLNCFSGLAAEIVHFYGSDDGHPNRDWYIKGSESVPFLLLKSNNDILS